VGVVREFYKPLAVDLAHASEVMEKVKPADEATGESCPNCGKPLVIKIGRFGKFIACNGYPDCRYTKQFQIKIGAHCPECGSELVQRMSKKKRVFYGCSAYPKCTFAINQKPLPQLCPKCGGLLTLYRGKLTKCTKCEYKGKADDTESSGTKMKVA
jgi:DNA topoisomerase-1